jgi:DNA polymerase-3 subunit epsilon
MWMETEEETGSDGGLLEAVPLAAIIVLAASADEVAEHEGVLGGLDKAVKGECIWRNYAAA